MKRLFCYVAFLCAALTAACSSTAPAPRAAHPEWAYDAVIYEMNVRQQTPEGTFAAAGERLPYLKELGVDILWLMPIHPIGVEGRKGSLGSYYAIRDYRSVNPEFGTMADFEAFLAKAHEMGFRVILDYVANHTSPDAAWVTDKPAEWYIRDSTGRPVVEYDWTDISKLNYEVPAVREEMSDVLKFWVGKGVDGFRCDMAMLMPDDFWKKSFQQIREINPDLFLLAESEGVNFPANGFDAHYAWELLHLMNDVAQGRKSTADIKGWIAKFTTEYPRMAMPLMFTSNHDENSWAGTEFERLGDAVETMSALTYTLPQGIPLIYTGQEVGFNRRFAFFEKDSVDSWTPNAHTERYKKLNALRHNNPALAAGERGGELVYMTGAVDNVLAFTREVEGNKVFCLFNLSSEPAPIIPTVAVGGDYTDAMSAAVLTVTPGEEFTLAPWEYRILIKN